MDAAGGGGGIDAGWDPGQLEDTEEARAARVEAALQTQMDMQRRLHQQLEVGAHLSHVAAQWLDISWLLSSRSGRRLRGDTLIWFLKVATP